MHRNGLAYKKVSVEFIPKFLYIGTSCRCYKTVFSSSLTMHIDKLEGFTQQAKHFSLDQHLWQGQEPTICGPIRCFTCKRMDQTGLERFLRYKRSSLLVLMSGEEKSFCEHNDRACIMKLLQL